VYLGRARAIVADEEQTFITAGTSHALTLLWTTLRAAGVRRVAHEDPAWERVHRTIIGNGLEPVPVRVDAKGLNVTDLYASDAQVVVVSPAHQYPSGVIMHPTRRIQLIRWALDTGGLIVEDDYDAEYRFGSRPIAPLRSSAAECVAYIGTTSKVLAPGLRLGWLLVPPRLAEAVAEVYSVSSAQPSVIDQAAFAALLENGDVDRHLRRTRRPYGARRATLLTAAASSAPALRITGGAAGLHVMAWLPEGSDEAGVVADAARRGIAVDGLHHACAVSRELGPALLLGYGAIATSSIPAAISSLAECLEGGQRMNRLSESSPAKRSMRHARGSFDQSHSALQPDAQTGLVTR
jgi:GntR family transcriptional regulator/MocR family aminotransferase